MAAILNGANFSKITNVYGKTIVVFNSDFHSHPGAMPYQCQTCQKGFTEEYLLKIHMRIHTEENTFDCRICAEKFTTNARNVFK